MMAMASVTKKRVTSNQTHTLLSALPTDHSRHPINEPGTNSGAMYRMVPSRPHLSVEDLVSVSVLLSVALLTSSVHMNIIFACTSICVRRHSCHHHVAFSAVVTVMLFYLILCKHQKLPVIFVCMKLLYIYICRHSVLRQHKYLQFQGLTRRARVNAPLLPKE